MCYYVPPLVGFDICNIINFGVDFISGEQLWPDISKFTIQYYFSEKENSLIFSHDGLLFYPSVFYVFPVLIQRQVTPN